MPKPTFFNLPDDKRSRVVEAAIDEFASRPYSKASISRICAVADIAKGSFYQYFTGKLDLYRWLVFDELGSRKMAFMRSLGPPPPGGLFVSFEHLVVAGMRWALANPRYVRVAEWSLNPGHASDLRPIANEVHAMTVQGMRAWLEQGQAAGEVRSDIDLDVSAELTSTLMRSGLDSLLRRRLGADMWELSAKADEPLAVDQDLLREIAHELLGFVRAAVGTGEGSGWALDIDSLPHMPPKHNLEPS
jgi:AcrR family transcriptional regulator